jgi:transposase
MRWTDEASTCLMPVVSKIADGLVRAPVAHADESGLRVASSLCWLHTVASETLTWYGIHTKRGMDAIEAHGILPKRMAVLVHDCWGPYWNLPGDHALCNAHLLRELIFVRETTQQTWPTRMIDVLCNTNALCEAARAKGDTALSAKQIENIARQYEAALIEGEAENPEKVRAPGQRGRVKQSTAFNLLRRMREHANEVLRFSTDLTVPFTNNLAERAIRMPKAKQKISGCFRTVKGAENFCVIRSYLDTLRKQGLNIFQALCATFHGKPIQPATG